MRVILGVLREFNKSVFVPRRKWSFRLQLMLACDWSTELRKIHVGSGSSQQIGKIATLSKKSRNLYYVRNNQQSKGQNGSSNRQLMTFCTSKLTFANIAFLLWVILSFKHLLGNRYYWQMFSLLPTKIPNKSRSNKSTRNFLRYIDDSCRHIWPHMSRQLPNLIRNASPLCSFSVR